MKFVGRQTELDLLEQHYAKATASLIPIYGRRRIGKSALIRHFAQDKPLLYFAGKKAPVGLQLEEFQNVAADFFQNDLLRQLKFSNWQNALRTIADQWRHPSKLILALDELQWIAEASPELPSTLQFLWDQEWKERKNLMIILCGSHLGFMEREVLGQKSPLFGRRSDQIHLKRLPFQEAIKLLPHYSTTDQAKAYFIVGGVPAYLERFDSAHSLDENIATEFCSELKFLSLEPHFLLREELRDPFRYFAILSALSEKKLRHKDIAERTETDPRVLSVYLDTLLQLGYIHQTLPVARGHMSRHRVHYEISDPFLKFWFSFIFPNQSVFHPGYEKPAFQHHIKPRLDAYYGTQFECLCREYLAGWYLRNQIPWERIGEYYDSTVQIDVVGMRKDNRIDLGECKWGTVSSLPSLATDLENKLRHYPNPGNCTLGRWLFMQKTKGSAPEGFHIQTLAGMVTG